MELVDLDAADLARSQARGVHQFEHRPVAKPHRAGLGRRPLDQLAHRSRRQHSGHLLPADRSLEDPCRIALDPAPRVQEAKEHPNGREMAGDRGGLEAAFPRQVPQVPTKVVGRDRRGFESARFGKVDEEVHKIAPVRLAGRRPQTGLHLEEGEELASRAHERRRFDAFGQFENRLGTPGAGGDGRATGRTGGRARHGRLQRIGVLDDAAPTDHRRCMMPTPLMSCGAGRGRCSDPAPARRTTRCLSDMSDPSDPSDPSDSNVCREVGKRPTAFATRPQAFAGTATSSTISSPKPWRPGSVRPGWLVSRRSFERPRSRRIWPPIP